MNRAFEIGRLTADPQTTTFDSGHSCCRFTIAVNRPQSRDRDQTADFIPIVAWDKTAENCVKYLSKGSQVAITGSIQTGSYERDGVKRNTFEIRAEQVEFLSRPQQGNDGETKPAQTQSKPAPQQRQTSIDDLQEVTDDEMPF